MNKPGCKNRAIDYSHKVFQWDLIHHIRLKGWLSSHSIKKGDLKIKSPFDAWQNRTVDLLLRRQLLYPAELKHHALI